jgi:predicted homoserine dehydrogenase-like protein
MAPIADLKSARFIKEGSEIGSSLIEQAKREMKIEPKDASKTLVTAWVVLNAVSAICHRNRMHTQAAKVETMRQRIRFMAGELATAGYHLVTDVPDSQVALVVTPKKPEEV